MEEEKKYFDPNKHSFAAHVTYDGLRLAVHAGPDADNIAIHSHTKHIEGATAHQLIDTIYYPKQVQFFNTLSQPTLVDGFIEEVKARSPGEAETEVYNYISRMLTYGHKIGRDIYQQIITSMTDTTSPEELHAMIEKEVQKEKQERTFTAARLEKYDKELDQKFPKMTQYFAQSYNANANYTRIEKEDIQTELLFFGIENYIKNIAWRDPGLFMHHN